MHPNAIRSESVVVLQGVGDHFGAGASWHNRQDLAEVASEHHRLPTERQPRAAEITEKFAAEIKEAYEQNAQAQLEAQEHLKALERKGYLTRTGLKSRALQPVDPPRDEGSIEEPDLVEVPVLGRIAAGRPILAVENREDTVHIDRVLLGNHVPVFGLRIVGDSMIGDGIFDSDYIFVRKRSTARPGEIVVAMIDGEATVKRYFPEADRIRFQPSNPTMDPIYVHASEFRPTQILGVVVGVYRKLG